MQRSKNQSVNCWFDATELLNYYNELQMCHEIQSNLRVSTSIIFHLDHVGLIQHTRCTTIWISWVQILIIILSNNFCWVFFVEHLNNICFSFQSGLMLQITWKLLFWCMSFFCWNYIYLFCVNPVISMLKNSRNLKKCLSVAIGMHCQLNCNECTWFFYRTSKFQWNCVVMVTLYANGPHSRRYQTLQMHFIRSIEEIIFFIVLNFQIINTAFSYFMAFRRFKE